MDGERKQLLEIIKDLRLNYERDISANRIAEIFDEGGYDVYLEGLSPYCGDGDMTLYLTYYDINANAVIGIEAVDWYLRFEDDDDVADYCLELINKVNNYRNKFLFLKQLKEGNGIE